MANKVGALFVTLGLESKNYIRDIDRAMKETDRSVRNIQNRLDSLNMEKARYGIALLIGGSAGIIALERKVLDVAGGFQQLKISLDTVTKGEGAKWFRNLNTMALELPVSITDVVNSFRRMTAMNLKPTVDDMKILVDTVSALGGNSDTLDGIVLALGQIATKNKLMSQEVRQLAERGIPAYKILQEKMGITAYQLEAVGHAAIDGNKAVRALYEGMRDAFTGQTQRMIETYPGMLQLIKNEIIDITRIGGDSSMPGVMSGLREIRAFLKENKGELAAGVGKVMQKSVDFAKYIIENRSAIIDGLKWVAGVYITVQVGLFTNKIILLTQAVYGYMKALGSLTALGVPASLGGGVTAGLGAASFFGGKALAEFNMDNGLMPYLPGQVGMAGRRMPTSGNILFYPSNIMDPFNLNKNKPFLEDNLSALQRNAMTTIQNRDKSLGVGTVFGENDIRAQFDLLSDIFSMRRGFSEFNRVSSPRRNFPYPDIKSMLGQFGGSWEMEMSEEDKKKLIDIQWDIARQRIEIRSKGYIKEQELEQLRFEQEIAGYGSNFKLIEAATEAHNNRMELLEQEKTDSMIQSAVQFGSYWGNMLTSVVEQAGGSFNNIHRMFSQMLKKMAIQATASGILSGLFNLFTGGTGGFGGGLIAGIMDVLHLPGKALGGNVFANEPVWVGERGRPELFVPHSNGKIVSDNISNDNSNTTINMNVRSSDLVDPFEFAKVYNEAKRRRLIA